MSFKWEWVCVPLTCVFTLWFLSVIDPACGWEDMTTFMNVTYASEYAKLGILGCVVVAVVSIARAIYKGNGK